MDRPIEKTFWTRKRSAFMGISVVLALLTLFALRADLGTSELRLEADRLTIATVQNGPFQEYVAVNGTAMPLRTVYLETSEGGRVEELFVEEGSDMVRGQEILRLTNTELELDILRREDQLFEQQNQLFNTRQNVEQQERDFQERMADLEYQILKQKRTFERTKLLAQEQLISALEFELQRDELDYLQRQRQLMVEREEENERFRHQQVQQMEQAVARMQKNLDTARGRLRKLTLEAPIDGQLTSLAAEIGQLKVPGDGLGQIDGSEGFRVRARIDQHYLPRVAVGQGGEVEFPDRDYQLEVAKIFAQVTDGRFDVDLEFRGDVPAGIKRGQTVHLRLALGDPTEVIHVDKGAFFQVTGGRWIFVLDESGQEAIRQDIRLGRQNPNQFEVLEGLRPGERVIISSYEALQEYDRIVFDR